MPLMINERIEDAMYKVVQDYKKPVELSEASSNNSPLAEDSLMVEIEGIHAAPYYTRNYTRYMPKCLKNSVSTWTAPYRRPLIKHHNEEDGEIIGRICNAEYKPKDTLSGTPALLFTVNVPGEAKEDVKNGLLETTSVGVIAHDVRCSICGKQLSEGDMCEHERGNVYDGETCCWDIYSMEGKELSYVIVPSDMYSKNINSYSFKSKKEQKNIKETINVEPSNSVNLPAKNIKIKENNMPEDLKKSSPEGETGKVSDKTPKSTDLSETINSLNEKITVLSNEKETLEKEKVELAEKIAALEKELKELKEKTEQDTLLLEEAEHELAEAKTSLRNSKVDTLQMIRESLGYKKLEDEKIKERSLESIEDSINDLKEQLNEKVAALKESMTKNMINSVQSPSLVKDTENLKEKVTQTNNLKAELENIFNYALSSKL